MGFVCLRGGLWCMVIGIFFGTCVYTLGNRNFPRGMELGGGEGRYYWSGWEYGNSRRVSIASAMG